MEATIPPKRRSGKGRRIVFRMFIWLVILSLAALSSYYWYLTYYPNPERTEPNYGGLDKPMFYKGQLLERSAFGEQEGLRLPLSFIQEYADPAIVYENETDSVILTTKDRVVRMKTEALTAMVNEKPMQLQFPVVKEGEDIYVPIEPFKDYYGLLIVEAENTGNIVIHKRGDNVQWGVADTKNKERPVAIREQPDVKSPIVADLLQDGEVMIWSEQRGWYRVQLPDGITGYARKQDVALSRVETIQLAPAAKAPMPWRPVGGKINLTWEQVVTRNPDTSKIAPMPGLNVISPTWFHLQDGEGRLQNLADASYVRWANGQDIQVWALFSNSFDPQLTSEALSTYDRRMRMTQQLLAFAQMYGFQGINIDFENVYLKDKDKLTQFVREMTPLLHEQGLVVSIDVTIKSTSENWSMFYDRPVLSDIVDYMIVMTYDEHWAASPISGSVASLPWVERGVRQLLTEEKVPASKLVLGVPFYTRIWTEETKNGKTNVSSRAVFMEAPARIMLEKGLKPVFSQATGQHYVEYSEGGKLNKIWLEDATSMKARIELVKTYDLAGVASWRRGYETPDIWQVIKETLEKRP